MRRVLAFALGLALAARASPAEAEATRLPDDDAAARPESTAGADTDPTKPVAFSLRDEHYDLEGGGWRNVFLLRADTAILRRQLRPRGLLLRGDVPFATVRTPRVEESGLGDVYGQALFVVRGSGPLLLALGSGLQAPSATDRALGTGKWILVPTVVPVVFFARKGFAFVKLQDWLSFAGEAERPDLHDLVVTPTLLWRVTRRAWTVVDIESRTDWEDGGRTWAKAGVLLGTMFTPRLGVSLEVELPFGEARPFDWNLKAVVFVTRF